MRLFTPVPHDGGQRNAHRADFLAFAAEGGRIGQMPRGYQPDHMRIERGTDRTGIDPEVGMAAERAVDLAIVHPRPNEDATHSARQGGAKPLAAAVTHTTKAEI